MSIVIVDYNMGNLSSILNMLKKTGSEAIVSGRVDDIENADKLVLPGVGAFDNAIKNITDLGLRPILWKKIKDGTPLLGICLGMQLLTKSSEEGTTHGFGYIDAKTKRFSFTNNHKLLKIPHMGWNTIRANVQNSLFDGLNENSRFYFVHSYHVVCKNDCDVLAKTHHGYEFASAIGKGNVYGVQFHPEKSHRFGKQLLKNFAGGS